MNNQTKDLHIQAVINFLTDATNPDPLDTNYQIPRLEQISPSFNLLIYFVAAHIAGKQDLVDLIQPYLDELKQTRL